MANLPTQIIQRSDIDCRLGIKSSLGNIASVISLAYVLYCANNKKSEIVYADEQIEANGKRKLILKDLYKDWITHELSIHEKFLNSNPLLTSQLESLQVGLGLMFRIAKISYSEFPNTDTKERTGGERFKKRMKFAINMKIIDIYLSAFDKGDVKQELVQWLKNEPSKSLLSEGLKHILTSFTEETQFKIRNQHQEIIFQQEGIYNSITKNENVVAKDEQEDVGPFRVFKSYVREGLHPFLTLENNEFLLTDNRDFDDYKKLVETALDLSPKKIVVLQEVPEERERDEIDPLYSRQTIFYGAPGTGKSNHIEERTNDSNRIRTTFHPDSDYSTFVGAYKPTVKTVTVYEASGSIREEEQITYSFVPQAFLKAYVEAWKRMDAGDDSPYYLVIEEINRGNCAQIFGDLFQLLDRDDKGRSRYAIAPDDDMRRHIAKELDDCTNIDENIRTGNEMRLPENLYIWATMNTSDQSLFPIDSAFKRRWDWEYMPIEKGDKDFVINIDNTKYDWWEFISTINEKIDTITGSEDKKLGYWFAKPANGGTEIDCKQFVSKVLFYLWNDVYKDYADSNDSIFRRKTDAGSEKTSFTTFFGAGREERIKEFMDYNEIMPLPEEEGDTEEIAEITNEETDASPSRYQWRQTFWNETIAKLNSEGVDYHRRAPIRPYYQISLGKTGISFIHSVKRNGSNCWVGLYIEKEQAERYYPSLLSQRADIEKIFNDLQLEWIEDKGYRSIRVTHSDFGSLDTDANRNAAQSWFVEMSKSMYSPFKEIISGL